MKIKFKIPHTLTLLLGIIIVMAVLTWFVPSGQFKYKEDSKKPTPIAGTYKQSSKIYMDEDGKKVDVRQGVKDVLRAPMKGTEAAADVVIFVILLGGAFGIIGKTGAIEAGLSKVVNMLQGKELLIIPVCMLLFGLGGSTYGLAEEAIPFYMVFVPLMMSLGYDSLTGAMIIFVGAQTGATASTANPFSVGIAQASAGIPISSGINFRWVQFFIYMAISIAFVMFYARRVKKDPTRSPMYELDKKNKERFLKNASGSVKEFKWYHGLILIGFVFGLVLMVHGVKDLGWYIEEISMIFFGIALFAAIIGKIAHIFTEEEIAVSFVEGCKDICYAALVIGVARGILVIVQDGQIIDTILNSLANALNGLPKSMFTTLNLLVQTGMNFLVPSSSAQAALTMPLLAPLGDLVKVHRQVIVTAYQYGCGLAHFISPTQGILMAALSIVGIPFQKWFKFILPLVIVLWVVAAIFLFVGLNVYPVI